MTLYAGVVFKSRPTLQTDYAAYTRHTRYAACMPRMMISNLIWLICRRYVGNSTTKRHQLIEIDRYTDDMPREQTLSEIE